MKKVLIIGHSFVVDMNRQLWDALAETKNVEVHMVLPDVWKSNLIDELVFKPNNDTDSHISKIYPIKCFFRGRGSFFFFSPLRLWKLLKEQQYDGILLAQETWSICLLQTFILKYFSRNRKSKFFIWICQNIKKKKLYWLRFLERFNTVGVDSILCCCSEIAGVIKWKGIQSDCRYFPFSFSSQKYQEGSYKGKNEKLTMGYMGRISWEKGVDTLLDGFGLLRNSGVVEKLIVAGAGPDSPKFSQKEKIEYLGAIPHNEAHEFYKKIDFFVLPSITTPFWKEQFGRVIIESVASGVPVVGSSSGAIPEVMGLVGMPYVFKEGDIEDFKRVVGNLILDMNSGKLNEIMDSAKVNCSKIFSHEKVAERFFHYLNKDDNFGLIDGSKYL